MRKVTIAIVSLVYLFIASAGALALNTNDLVLYFSFDEGSGSTVKDQSGNGNDGEFTGSPQWADGYYDGGLYLAEIPDFVLVPDSPTLDIEESLTLAIWANVESLPDGSCSFFQKPTAYMLHTTNGGDGCKIDPLVFIGGSYGAWPTPVVVSAPFGDWHHYAATYDGTKYDLYIDGERIDSYDRTGGGPIDQDDNELAIGRDTRAGCTERNMPGTLDEAMVWSRALSENEIAEVMSGGLLAVSLEGKLATCWGSLKTH
jgi:hypothetical protein